MVIFFPCGVAPILPFFYGLILQLGDHLYFFLILVPAILLRIRIEEKILFGIEGYSEFAKKRKWLFPAVW